MTSLKHRVAIFDLDNSTFRTHIFHMFLTQTVSKIFPSISRKAFRGEIPLFDATHQGYDIEQHLEHYGINFDELRPRLMTALRKYDLIYDDAVGAFKYLFDCPDTDVWNLTLGVPKTQKLKLELQFYELKRRLGHTVPPISHQVISGDKGRFLAERWSDGFKMGSQVYENAILVDDNPSQLEGLNPRPGLKIYQIVRPRAKYGFIGRSDIREISDLRFIQ